MENNVIIRRIGSANAQSYDRLSDDLIEAFDGYEGVTILKTVEDGNNFTKIFLTQDNRIYILIEPNSGCGARMSIHCGTGSVEGTNYAYIDKRPITSSNFAYNILRTSYGVAFTALPNLTDNSLIASDGNFENFFTTFIMPDGTRVNGFVFVANPDDESTRNSYSYLVTDMHRSLERFDFSNYMIGTNASHTVLTNFASYSFPLIAEHLYKKIQTENSRFGKIMLNNHVFLSGSHICLELDSNDE